LEKSYQYDRAPTTVEYRIRGGEGNLTYYWDFGDGETESVLPHAEKTYFVSGKYPVRVRAVNEAGCETWDEDTMWVRPTAPGIPSAFTPNGDGLNDVFKIENLTSYLSVRLVVYGRWGLPVFESNRPDVFWDGNNPHGVPLPDGVYVYKFTAVETNGDVIEMSGTITLMR
jgi:gliding motility-associated-like protein